MILSKEKGDQEKKILTLKEVMFDSLKIEKKPISFASFNIWSILVLLII